MAPPLDFFKFILFSVYECLACIYVNAPILCKAHGSQERALDYPELELGMELATMWMQEQNLGLLQKEQVLLSTEHLSSSPTPDFDFCSTVSVRFWGALQL